jgi:SAM-dependent methyltransferase
MMNMPRCLESELLDELLPYDPRAIRSRRDLRRINVLMMNTAIVAHALDRAFPATPPRTIIEIGAGDGTFVLRLAKRNTARWRNVQVVLLDRQDIVSSGTRKQLSSLGWQTSVVMAEVFEWLTRPVDQVFDVMIANLFLHHFDDVKLRALLSLAAQRTRVFVACEPRRSAWALAGSRLLGVIGCNDVSRHDAVVSVRAGFDAQELSAVWPADSAWTLQESARGLFSHCFVAARYGE